jgi:hypothetical protein
MLALTLTPRLAWAQDKPKDFAKQTLQEKLQGKWSKTNHRFSFEIKGNKWMEFVAEKPLAASNTGMVEYPPGKDYAIVRAVTGHRLWIFSGGKDVVAVETFGPDGKLWEDGRIFYRFGTVQP